jgi:hypothetical protein
MRPEESQQRCGTGWRATRREWLQVGGLSLLGLTSAELAQLLAMESAKGTKRPRAKSCVFIFLFGGPSHIDLWDMKPAAPTGIRGDFQPISTSVAGIQMNQFCLLRSMTHHMPVHGPACSEMYTGREYFGPPTTDQALPQDWPSMASLVARFGKSAGRLPPSIVLPWYTQFVGQDRRIAGQTGGRMGESFNPVLIDGDPSHPDFRVPGLKLFDDVDANRLMQRRGLLHRMQASSANDPQVAGKAAAAIADYSELAFAMLRQQAVDLQNVPSGEREPYGLTKFGQSLLMARRFIEAGVSLVTVNWNDDTANDKVSPHWDTHHDNFAKLKNNLCPVFDQAFATFLRDLSDRGLLDSTLIVATGEFGRTPRIGQFSQNAMTEKTGRDHWPHAFTVLLAGGGIRGGQVYGTTSRDAAYVIDKPVSPADLSATIFHHLGIDPSQKYFDHFQHTDQKLAEGKVVRDLG